MLLLIKAEISTPFCILLSTDIAHHEKKKKLTYVTSTNGPTMGSCKSKDGYLCSDQDGGYICQIKHKSRTSEECTSWAAEICWNFENIPKENFFFFSSFSGSGWILDKHLFS